MVPWAKAKIGLRNKRIDEANTWRKFIRSLL
jgi:hypothetical protein